MPPSQEVAHSSFLALKVEQNDPQASTIVELISSFGDKVVKYPFVRVKFTERFQYCICTAPAK